MKKYIFILALIAIAATGAFAQWFPLHMAAGGGLLFDWSGNNGFEATYVGYHYKENLQVLSFGGFGFFDATYAELDVGFAYGSWTHVLSSSTIDGGSALQLGFTLLGKYPIDLGNFTIFPLLGADYNMVLSGGEELPSHYFTKNPGDRNQFGFLAGAGLDYPLPFSDALFLRAEVLFHLRFPSKASKDSAEHYVNNDVGRHLNGMNFGMGPRIKISVGYRFGGGSGSKSSASSTHSQSELYMLVNSDTLNVRSGPSADNSVVGQLARNTRVEVLDSSGTWWSIRSGNIQGYVNSSFLTEEN